MLIRSIRKISKIKKYTVTVPLNYQYKVVTKIDSYIKAGENLAYGNIGDFVEVSLPDEIKDYSKKDNKYLKVTEGEIVLEGTTLLSKGKLLSPISHEVLSPMDGVVNLSHIDKGIIRIVGEKKKKYLLSPVSGLVADINHNHYIKLEIDAIKFDCMTVYGDGNIEGEVVKVEDFKNMHLYDVKGKIAFTKSIDVISFEKLSALGAKGIITENFIINSGSDLDRVNKLPLAIVFGFGELENEKLPDFNYALIDKDLSAVIIQNPHFFVIASEENFEELSVEDYVKITRADLWGKEGQVLELKENSAKIELGIKIVEIPYIYLIKSK